MIYVRDMMKVLCCLLLFIVGLKAGSISPAEAELELSQLHNQLSTCTSDAMSDTICEQMRGIFISCFDDPTTFDYPFEKLQLCKLKSADDRVRLLNWNLPYKDGTHKYFCFVLVRNKKNTTYTWTELIDNQREVEKLENKYLTPDKWFGALYYEIIAMDRKGRGDTYTLLGWDGKDNMTNRKVIDAMTITNKKIRLGATIFSADDGVRKRYILEYSNDVSASVRYHPKKGCIVMDHLSPKNPLMTGIFADYGPDGSYDLFMLKKGKWEYISDINIAEFADGNDKQFYDPRPSRRRK